MAIPATQTIHIYLQEQELYAESFLPLLRRPQTQCISSSSSGTPRCTTGTWSKTTNLPCKAQISFKQAGRGCRGLTVQALRRSFLAPCILHISLRSSRFQVQILCYMFDFRFAVGRLDGENCHQVLQVLNPHISHLLRCLNSAICTDNANKRQNNLVKAHLPVKSSIHPSIHPSSASSAVRPLTN